MKINPFVSSVLLFTLFSISLPIVACKKEKNPLVQEAFDEEMSGGSSTTFDFSDNAFGQVTMAYNAEEQKKFVVGNSFFRLNWVTAPASTQNRDGLGPLFNSASCSGCHHKDGRGLMPASSTENPTALLFRLSQAGIGPHGEPLPHAIFGGQLQNFSIQGIMPEATVSVHYTEQPGNYSDGSSYSLRVPNYSFLNYNYFGDLNNAQISPRLAPQMPGLGLLESIAEADIIAYADPTDQNQDGISGKPNYVWNVRTQKTELGRFGWKANQPDIYQQTAAAFNGDIGITTNLFPNHEFTSNQLFLQQIPSGGIPELEDSVLDLVVLYSKGLAVPARRDFNKPEVQNGKRLFINAKCGTCHKPEWKTSHQAEQAFKNQKIFPYTDLLLHDMGENLSDNRPDYLAEGKEWRTPPLWGLGLIETVAGKAFYLHDGRARTLEEAILWHGGEAEQSKVNFVQMNATERKDLISFLKSL